MESEKKIAFNFHREGRFLFKSSVFSLAISDLGLKKNVGVSRDILIPFYSIFREEFPYLIEDSETLIIQKYRGVGNGSEEILRLRGEYKNEANSKKIEVGQNLVDLRLVSIFDRYQDGEIFHKLNWASGEELGSLQELTPSIDEFIVGIGFYISDFRFCFDEFAKVGLVYRALNIPSKTTTFEFKIDKDLEISFKIGRGGSPKFCDFVERLFICLVEVFSLEQEIAEKFEEIVEKIRQRSGI